MFPFQKWQCVEDPTGKLRLYKCKGMASLYAPRMQALMARGPAPLASAAAAPAATSNSCNCAASAAFQAPVVKRKRLFPKKSEFPRLTPAQHYSGGIEMEAIYRLGVAFLSFVLFFKRYRSCLQSFAKRAVYLGLKLPAF